MFEQLHSGELQLRDIGTFILEGRCSNSIQARRRHHDTPNLSKNAQKMRKRFADLWQRYMSLQSVYPCHIWCFGAWAHDSGLRPSSRTCHLLERILLKDDRISNPYLTWSRQDLVSALMQRKEQLPKNSSRVSYRLSLEAADQNRRFPFMKLPSEIRMIIYEQIMQVDFGKASTGTKESRLATALAARRIAIPDPDNNIRKVYRHALEIADTERRFPFMKLPKDVRMVVYDYALTYETVQTSRPPLLSVCHQIREEGSPTFFRINEFNIRWERSSG
ncbi:unnamed protein product [Aureobasidium pullulans]|nr:unnamed protein product [Aureobasidium pullulans]